MSRERTKNGCGVKVACFLGLEGLRHCSSPNLPDLGLRLSRMEPYRWERLGEAISAKGCAHSVT